MAWLLHLCSTVFFWIMPILAVCWGVNFYLVYYFRMSNHWWVIYLKILKLPLSALFILICTLAVFIFVINPHYPPPLALLRFLGHLALLIILWIIFFIDLLLSLKFAKEAFIHSGYILRKEPFRIEEEPPRWFNLPLDFYKDYLPEFMKRRKEFLKKRKK